MMSGEKNEALIDHTVPSYIDARNVRVQARRRDSTDVVWNPLLAVLPFNEVITVNLLRFIRCDRSNPNIMVDHAFYEYDP